MSRFAASDMGLRCLPMTHKKDARFIWVNVVHTFVFFFLKKKNRFPLSCLVSGFTGNSWSGTTTGPSISYNSSLKLTSFGLGLGTVG